MKIMIEGKGRLFNMSLDTIIKKLGKGIDKAKQILEPGIDQVLLFGALNTGVIYKISELIDKSNLSDTTNNMLMMATGASLAIADYYMFISPKTKKIRKLIGKINKKIDKKRVASWIKTGTLAGFLTVNSMALKPYVEQVHEDISRLLKPDKSTVTLRIQSKKIYLKPNATKERPAVYDSLGYKSKTEHDFTGTRLANAYTEIGRLQRMLRWTPITDAVERIYNLPQGLLRAMVVEESMGNPVQPNAKGDGGLGLIHQQWTTAQEFNMNVFGYSDRTSDKEHGKEIKGMLKHCNYNPARIQKYDERVHLIKNLDAGARMLSVWQETYGSLEKALERYGPGKTGSTRATTYRRKITGWMEKLKDPKLYKQAADDFAKNNNKSFNEYLRKWHEMADNWGLDTYIKIMGNPNNPLRNQISKNNVKKKPQWKWIKVKQGDTLYGLATRVAKKAGYNVSVRQLRKWNKLHNNNIKPGQQLRLYRVHQTIQKIP